MLTTPLDMSYWGASDMLTNTMTPRLNPQLHTFSIDKTLTNTLINYQIL